MWSETSGFDNPTCFTPGQGTRPYNLLFSRDGNYTLEPAILQGRELDPRTCCTPGQATRPWNLLYFQGWELDPGICCSPGMGTIP